jgi:hypothetical protein
MNVEEFKLHICLLTLKEYAPIPKIKATAPPKVSLYHIISCSYAQLKKIPPSKWFCQGSQETNNR